MISSILEQADYGLLVPRKQIRLKRVNGHVKAFDSVTTIFENPIVLTTSDRYDLVGIASGHRSALVNIGGIAYKIKGCAIEKAFTSDGLYRRTRNKEAPKGGVLLADAENELQRTRQIGELLTQEGFRYPYEPHESFLYGKQWMPKDEIPQWLRDFYEGMKDFSYIEQLGITLFDEQRPVELGALVMKIKGDTRLPEVYLQQESSTRAVSDIAYKLGLTAGAQKRITHEYYWGADAHLGNYVVFLEEDHVHMAMVDFEETRPRLELNMVARLLQNFWERKEIPRSVSYAGRNFRKKDEPSVPSSHFRVGFKRGFDEGWKNPEKRESIHINDLREAYC